MGLFKTALFFSVCIQLCIFANVQSASIIDINTICYDNQSLQIMLPQCNFQVDLIGRQRCVKNMGMFLILDVEAKEAVINCYSTKPIQVEILTENYLSYGDGDKFVVIHRRSVNSGNSSQHTISIPIVHGPDFKLSGITSPIRKYSIGTSSQNGEDVHRIEMIVISEGSGVLFSVGSRTPAPTSEIVYIPCLYDYTTGIKIHKLSGDKDGKSVAYSADPSTYNPLKGFPFNLTTEPNLYGNHSISCEGEGPAVNPFLPGPYVYEAGFGLQFHAGLNIRPDSATFECYTPPCKLYCEYEEPIHLEISGNMRVEGRLLFKTFEAVTRYLAEMRDFGKTKSARIKCIRSGDGQTLHTWEFSRYDIVNHTSSHQTLKLRVGPISVDWKNSSRLLQCISETSKLAFFASMPCGNSKECKYYSRCVHEKSSVKKWQSHYTIPKYCSAPLSMGVPCHNNSGSGECMEISIFGSSSGRLFCTAQNGVAYEANYFTGVDGMLIFDPPNSDISSSSIVRVQSHHVGNMYFGGAFWFSCESASFYTEHGLQWKLKWKNGSFSSPTLLEDNHSSLQVWSSMENPKRKSRILLESPDVVAVVCSAPLMHTNDWVEQEVKLGGLQDSTPPTFKVPKVAHFKPGAKASLECSADGYPTPQVKWVLDKEQQKSNHVIIESRGMSSTLTFTKFTEQDVGDYLCTAFQDFMNVTRKVSIAVKSNDWIVAVPIGITIAVLLIAVGVLVTLYRKWKTTQMMLQKISDAELEEFLNGVQGSENQEEYRYVFRALAVPYNADYELDPKNLDFDREEFLGSGQFGVVYLGSVVRNNSEAKIPAAIKTLKSNCRSEDIVSFLSEVKLMIFLGKHANLVEIIGASTKNCKRGEVYLALELCDRGSLLKYLQHLSEQNSVVTVTKAEIQTEDKSEAEVDTQLSESTYVNLTSSIDDSKLADLIQWSYEISCGMEYMASKGLIHGDLAARNVLLQSHGDRLVAKISDFGLSRKLYEYTQYVKTKQEPLPWRWLSPEALRQLRFSSKSDVWAYGICLWEIFSLGDVPYTGFSYDMEFVNMIECGLRNPKPKFAQEMVHDLMKKCWSLSSHDRPSFQEIKRLYETNELDETLKISISQATE